ncbi:MAG: ABC transporter permease [Thermodesulfobacteriota bacterium]
MVAVFLKDLRLIFRDRWALLFFILVPIVVISIIASALFDSDEGQKLMIPIVNEDQGPVANAFIKLLSKHADPVEMPRAEAEYVVRDQNRAPAALVFPEGMSKAYLQGRPSEITMLTDPAQAVDLNTVKVLLLLMDKDAAALADPLEEERIVMKEQNLTGNRISVTSFEQNVPGFSIMFVLLAVVFSTAMGLHDERDWGTLPRLLVAPAGFTWMLIGKLGARFVMGVVQMLVLFLWGHFVFNVSLGSSVIAFFLLTCAVVFVCVSIGLMIAGIARTREQTQPMSLAVVMAFSALGGLWWPQSITPEWMRDISPIVFTTWAMHGMNDLVLRGRGLAAIVEPVSVLVVYGLVTLLLGLWLFRTRHSAR